MASQPLGLASFHVAKEWNLVWPRPWPEASYGQPMAIGLPWPAAGPCQVSCRQTMEPGLAQTLARDQPLPAHGQCLGAASVWAVRSSHEWPRYPCGDLSRTIKNLASWFGNVTFHASHVIGCHRGVIWCDVCGAWSSGQRTMLLKKQCPMRIAPYMRWGRAQLRAMLPL